MPITGLTIIRRLLVVRTLHRGADCTRYFLLEHRK